MDSMRSVANGFKLVSKLLSNPKDATWFLKTYFEWQRSAPQEWKASFANVKMYLKERHESAGSAKGHYFLQDIWAAQRVHEFAPAEHVDVGSRIDGFVAHVASFCPVKYVDIRALETGVPGLTGIPGSICDLPFEDGSVSSLSCLHVIEHIGLGRYGDPIDPDGWRKGMAELHRVLAPGGQLLIGAPCGRPRVMFHAHRIFAPRHIINAIPGLTLQEFSLIPDGRATAWQADAQEAGVEQLKYGCGLFRFTR